MPNLPAWLPGGVKDSRIGYRHPGGAGSANVTFADGHVDLEKPVADSLDKRLPNQFIGQLRPEILTLP